MTLSATGGAGAFGLGSTLELRLSDRVVVFWEDSDRNRLRRLDSLGWTGVEVPAILSSDDSFVFPSSSGTDAAEVAITG